MLPGGQRGLFVVLEGLSGVGKSAVAEALVQRMPADLVSIVSDEFRRARRAVDNGNSVLARFYLYLAAAYSAAAEISTIVENGRHVVTESFVHRTLATHAALGMTNLPELQWSSICRPDLVVLLTTDETVRKARLLNREKDRPLSRWHQLVEANVSVAVAAYNSFRLPSIDTTSKSVEDVAIAIIELLREERPFGVDEEIPDR